MDFGPLRRVLLGASGLVLIGSCAGDPPAPPPPPTVLALTIVDAVSGTPIPNAELVLLSDGETRRSDATGVVSAEVVAGAHAYRAQAPGYLASPRPPRPPREVSAVSEVATEIVIRLEPRPGATSGGVIRGRVSKGGEGLRGVLVVADATDIQSAYTDAAGDYAIFGLSSNYYVVRAFLAGHASSVVDRVRVTEGGVASGVNVELTNSIGAVVGGFIVGGSGTSSIALVHDVTQDPIPGLSVLASLGGAWSISGVPPGAFRVRALLEEDGQVLDPQVEIGEGPARVEVTGTSSVSMDLFVGDAIREISPTASSTVSTPVRFAWSAVPNADFYVLDVRDAAGQSLWGGFDARQNPRVRMLAPMTRVTYMGAEPLAPGALYSWRVYAAKDVTTGQLYQLIGASEELSGEFRVQH